MTSPTRWPHPIPERRLAPLPPEEQPQATRELLDSLRFGSDQPVGNIFATMAHHRRLLKRWSAMGAVLLFQGELPPRDRETLILRTAWNCQAHYEWMHHVPMAKAAGLGDEDITRITELTGSASDSSSSPDDGDALLLRAADELHADSRLSDPTWAELAKRYSPAQLVELCMLVGQYHLVAFTLNSLGVQYEGASIDLPAD